MQLKQIVIDSSTFSLLVHPTKKIIGNPIELKRFLIKLDPILTGCIRKHCKTYIPGWGIEDFKQELMPAIFTAIFCYNPNYQVPFIRYLLSNLRKKIINIYDKYGKRYYIKRYRGELPGATHTKNDTALVTTHALLNPHYTSELEYTLIDPTTEDDSVLVWPTG